MDECDRATTLPHTYLPTYGSCGTGSKGWSSLMTPRFIVPTMMHLLKWVERGKKNSNSMTIGAEEVVSISQFCKTIFTCSNSSGPWVKREFTSFFLKKEKKNPKTYFHDL